MVLSKITALFACGSQTFRLLLVNTADKLWLLHSFASTYMLLMGFTFGQPSCVILVSADTKVNGPDPSATA